ncbi:MAG: transposase [Candidatus Brocadia sp. WS118]|nr:MAG: transposase [Candidatus Brocadia sp. WS118]
MTYDPDKHHRRSIRLKEYDYSKAVAYFITICTHNKECILGDVIHGEMRSNEYGMIVENEWVKTAEIRSNIIIDKYIVMPNHVHGIIIIQDNGRDTVHRVPTFEQFGRPTSNSISTIIRSFKAVTKKRINEIRKSYGKAVWQSRFYEHIIRNEKNLNQIREYIINNPLQWELDRENPNNKE